MKLVRAVTKSKNRTFASEVVVSCKDCAKPVFKSSPWKFATAAAAYSGTGREKELIGHANAKF